MKELSPNEVETLLKEGKPINIIDVREDEEVREGKIEEAVHIPLGSIEERMDELDKEQEQVLVCRSGKRSDRAARFLESQGYKVSNMVGGMLEWKGSVK